jgi:hypothetical protein
MTNQHKMNISSFQLADNESEVKLSTMAIGHITKLPHVGLPANDEVKNFEVFVTAIADKGVSHEIVNSYM